MCKKLVKGISSGRLLHGASLWKGVPSSHCRRLQFLIILDKCSRRLTSQRSNNMRKHSHSVIQSCMKVEDPYCIATLSCPAFTRMYSIVQEMLMGYQDTKSGHRHLRALFLKASRRHLSTKATVGPWDRGKFESRSMQAYCRTSEHHMEPVSWNFITACECFI